MASNEVERSDVPPEPALPAVSRSDRAREVIDAKFRVLWAPWQRVRAYWWAVGAYIVYCAVLWGLAALAGWVL